MNLIVKQKIFMLLCIVTLICSLSACESDDNVSGSKGYEMKSLSTGAIDAVIVPTRIR